MKRTIAGILAAIFALLVAVPLVVAGDNPDTVLIDEVQDKFPAVQFKHKEHQKKEGTKCVTCHHKTEEGKEPEACSECHGKDDKVPGFKDAMHKLCKDCHKENNGPTKCTDCHKK